MTFRGEPFDIHVISDGAVMPYIQDAYYDNVVLLPPEVRLVHLSWMANDGLEGAPSIGRVLIEVAIPSAAILSPRGRMNAASAFPLFFETNSSAPRHLLTVISAAFLAIFEETANLPATKSYPIPSSQPPSHLSKLSVPRGRPAGVIGGNSAGTRCNEAALEIVREQRNERVIGIGNELSTA
ncbi:hypothetical protein LSH36_178g06036 [Paralvinella palmiformis]|uniref:Uncharacterized protein n=1 Tax=Paralvinella palmiformis TaxID=53620 RepID=A0AAD9JRY2_9ANNE|nr:hypothetical protein LSH36_178g06036 [Paralvinella palmiformis]